MRKNWYEKFLGLMLALICALSFSSAVRAGEEEIRIGATLPLTGDLASYGNLIKDGIELALSDLRAEGLNVKVFYEDVPAPGPAALTAVQTLINTDHVQGIAGNFWNPAIPIMAAPILQNRILTFHTAAADDLILNAGDYIVSTNTKIKDEAYKLAEYAYNTLHARTACVLYISTTFGDHYQMHFIERFTKLGGKILSLDKTNLGDSDLRTPLTKVRSLNPDVFFAAYFGNNLGLVLKQAREIGVKQQILSVYESEDPSVLSVAGPAAEGLRFFVGEAESETPSVKDFRVRFEARFHYAPRVLASNAYDATKILVHALDQCRGSTECAKDEVYLVKDYDGASGKLTIDSEGGAEKPFVLKTVRDGKFVRM
jgi:branched-chain amino acid transport system substrate-binding protein